MTRVRVAVNAGMELVSGTEQSNLRPSEQMRVECFMLCDYAKEENQKLYIVGGGWNRVRPEKLPFVLDFYLAIKIVAALPISEDPLSFVLETTDEDGNLVTDPAEVTIIPRIRRPSRPGSEAPLFLPLDAQLVIQEHGRYTVTLAINEEPVARTRFVVDLPRSIQEGTEAERFVEIQEDSEATDAD